MVDGASLEFIGAQLAKVLEGQHKTNERLDKLDAGMIELQIAMAATRTDLGAIKATQQSHGARLNAIDGRLAIIEGHLGLVKA
jgi:hypothetical protein